MNGQADVTRAYLIGSVYYTMYLVRLLKRQSALIKLKSSR